ncbi:hypothetical protein DERF_008080 [Dermatophagoides farinae]|uniref:Uncharacterized protein n=1 Tax=Dermatophagoides farinae TaxID=6954 RepID=A0A922HZ78_DERFA|nr:hypothetical protein DERF_008080 [Dermatophagoides farinae]
MFSMKPIVVGHFYLAVYIAAISIKKAIIIIKNKRNHHNFIFIQPPLNESNQIIISDNLFIYKK